MSTNDNWMPLYIGDYLGSTMHLQTVEHGAYVLLLVHYWRNGPLPDDDKKLAGIVRMSLIEWTEIKATIREFFTAIDGRLHQKRADAERAKRDQISCKRSEVARNRHMQNRCKPDAIAHANALQLDTHARAGYNHNNNNKEDTSYLPLTPIDKPARKPKASAAPMPDLPDWMPQRAWNDFVMARAQMKKPLTTASASVLIRQMDGFRNRGISIEAALDASTAAGWQGVFEPKSNQTFAPQSSKSPGASRGQAARDAISALADMGYPASIPSEFIDGEAG